MFIYYSIYFLISSTIQCFRFVQNCVLWILVKLDKTSLLSCLWCSLSSMQWRWAAIAIRGFDVEESFWLFVVGWLCKQIKASTNIINIVLLQGEIESIEKGKFLFSTDEWMKLPNSSRIYLLLCMTMYTFLACAPILINIF